MREKEFRLGTESSRRINPVYFSSRVLAQVETKKDSKGCTYAPFSVQIPAPKVCALEFCVIKRNAVGLHYPGMDK